MAQFSKIEWTKHTCNLWWGCTRIHRGCDFCFACDLANRWGHNLWGNDKPRLAIKSAWDDLAKFQKIAEKEKTIHQVFVGSMFDIFEKPMPIVQENGQPVIEINGYVSDNITTGDLRNYLFEIVVPNSPNLQFLLLTKRPSNINKFIPPSWIDSPPSNVMFGTSPVDQQTFDTLVPQLRMVNGKRFLSIEPQLEDITKPDFTGIDWVIQGGESGPHKRPFDTSWARRIRDICLKEGIPYFFKQIDKVQEIPEDLMIREMPIL